MQDKSNLVTGDSILTKIRQKRLSKSNCLIVHVTTNDLSKQMNRLHNVKNHENYLKIILEYYSSFSILTVSKDKPNLTVI